ncbi:MAG TPA: diacylglycerol kinase family protein [Flavitalea sp.]|nr:diacylglycerol kinase family protein [Flavitalea sp.]
MKKVALLHNPEAGDGDHFTEALITAITGEGFECRYSSIKKKGWKIFEKDADLLAIAGGDGTVRKVAKELLHRALLEKTYPIGLLPCGTANNIAKTLSLEKQTDQLIRSWKKQRLKKYDVGRISNLAQTDFFLESLGFGIFPYLMMEMKATETDKDDPQLKIQTALKLMHKIVLCYAPKYCRLEIDGTDHSGKFLMAEIMNTHSIGPNMMLSPQSDPGDGQFEVVLAPEEDKEQFAAYIQKKINGEEPQYAFTCIPAKKINISWEGSHLHVDDELIKTYEGRNIRIDLREGALNFFSA